MHLDTIAAVATAMTNSGIGIIRVSGDEAIEVVNKIYHSKNGKKKLVDYKSHTINYGYIYDKDELVDEVMVSIMYAPKSYTAENTVEINCHGGIIMMNKILDLVIKHGARIAEPGEFTKRAFLNGRIDLSEAEAVMDIINAKSNYALISSINQLNGSIRSIIKKLRDDIIYEIAFIESALDDPEHISIEGYGEKANKKIDNLLIDLDKLYKSAENGKVLKEGINTVIVGKPNAGKSSLLNSLLGEERAIVTNIAGTTRDVLEETIQLDGISLNIIDTAGIRSTEDIVEKIGVEKAKTFAKDADLVICVIDSSNEIEENDRDIIEIIKGKKCIFLLNKTDLPNVINEEVLGNLLKNVDYSQEDIDNIAIIKTSTLNNVGIENLENKIKELFFTGKLDFNDEVYITNLRHKEAIKEAINSLNMVKESISMDMPEDFLSIDFMNAYSSLGCIIGEEVGEDLVNEIFTKFCMGK